MNQIPTLFVENLSALLSGPEVTQLQDLSRKYGRLAALQHAHRYNLHMHISLAQIGNFCENNYGNVLYKLEGPKGEYFLSLDSVLEKISANRKFLNEVRVVIDASIGKAGEAYPWPLNVSSNAKHSRIFQMCRGVNINLFSNREITAAEQTNVRQLIAGLRIPSDQSNVSAIVNCFDQTCHDTVFTVFGARTLRSLVLDRCMEAGHEQELLHVFFKPNFEQLIVENEAIAEGIVQMWTKQPYATRKFFLGPVGAELQNLLSLFKSHKFTWDKNGLRLARGRYLPNILPYNELIKTNLQRTGDRVGRFLFMRHPRLRSYYCCVFLVTSLSEVMQATDEESTYKTAKLKKFAELMETKEFASISEKVCVFFCDRAK